MKMLYALILIFFITACTKVNFGYRLAPGSMMSTLDDTFNFKSERLKQVRSQLDLDFKTNRTQVAKVILNLVDDALLLANKKKIVEDDFKLLLNSVQNTRSAVVQLFKGSFETVINDLTSKEIENLSEFTIKKTNEAAKEISEKDNYLEKQLNSFEKLMKFLFDSANKDQLNIYNQFIIDHYDLFKEQLEYRKNFIKKFDSLIATKPELLKYVMNYYAGDLSVHSVEQQKSLDNLAVHLYKMMLKVWNASTDKQKDALKENLQDLRSQLLDMIKT